MLDVMIIVILVAVVIQVARRMRADRRSGDGYSSVDSPWISPGISMWDSSSSGSSDSSSASSSDTGGSSSGGGDGGSY